MMEQIRWKGDKSKYQPRIRAVRVRDLYRMKEYTHRPMTVLVDEALSLYLSAFLCSPEYSAWCEQIERKIDEELGKNPDLDDYEDLSNYIDNQ
jgi:hypothetical protein